MSQKNATVAVVSSPFSETVALFCDSVDMALAVTLNNASDKQAVRLSDYHT